MSDHYMANLETLWHNYHRRIRNYLKKHMRDDGMTDEMLAVVYYRAVVATANGHGAREHAKAWLFTIARSAMYDHWRHFRDLTFVDYDTLTEWQGDDAPLWEQVYRDEVAARVRNAVDRLVDTQRDVMRARLAGASFDEIADERGVNYNTCKQTGFRAYQTLRKRLADVESS